VKNGRRATFSWPTLDNVTENIISYLVIAYIGYVSKKLGEWYQKTNKREDTNKLTLLAFKIIP
jgi:hypothetical protein